MSEKNIPENIREEKKESNAIRCIKCRQLHLGVIITAVPIILITNLIFGFIAFSFDNVMNMLRFGAGLTMETFLLVGLVVFTRQFCDPKEEAEKNWNLLGLLGCGLFAFILGTLVIFSGAEEISALYLNAIYDEEGADQMIIASENIPCLVWHYSSTWDRNDDFKPISLSYSVKSYSLDRAFEERCDT